MLGPVGARVPRFDLAYLYGSSALGALVAALVLLRPSWVVPLWWIFTLLADGPHLIATVTRSYLDPRDRRRLGRAAWLAPLWILLGPAALLAGKLTGSGAPWQLFLALAGVWSTYHFIRQHAGLLAVCERRAGAEPRTMRVDALFLQGALWAMTLVYVLAVPGGRRAIGLPPFAGPGEEEAAFAIALALAAATLGWLGRLVARPRRRWLAAGFVLGPVGALYVFNLFVVGAREPLFDRPANIEQAALGVTLVGGLVHGLQYLGIVLATNRRRAQRDGDDGAARLAARLGRAPARDLRRPRSLIRRRLRPPHRRQRRPGPRLLRAGERRRPPLPRRVLGGSSSPTTTSTRSSGTPPAILICGRSWASSHPQSNGSERAFR